MTRLVGVRAVCDVCSSARAEWFCVVHRHVSCAACNAAVHNDSANAHHQRVDLSCAVTALPFCEACDKAPATSYCESEGTTLCDTCDAAVHRTKSCAAHQRRLISKALTQRTVSFTGMPPPPASSPPPAAEIVSATTVARATSAAVNTRNKLRSPGSPRGKGRRRGPSSPMKRRAKRESVSHTSPDERTLRDTAPRARQASATTTRAQQARPPGLPLREASPATQTSVQQQHGTIQGQIQGPIQGAMPADGHMAYMQAMTLMGNRESVDFFSGAMHGFFGSDLMNMAPDTNLMLDDTNASGTRRNSALFPTNIAPHPGSMPPHPEASTVAAAAAAATAAGEMFLLSAASSDQHGSGSSEGIVPQFTGLAPPPDAAGLAAAATAAAQNTVAAHAIRPVRADSPGDMHGDGFMVQHANAALQTQRRRRLRPAGGAPADVLVDGGMMDVQRGGLFDTSEQIGVQLGDAHAAELRVDAELRRQNGMDHLSNRHYGVTYLGGTDERDHYPLTDFDIPRDDFGAFDALDLSSFDHNGVANFGQPPHRSRGCSLDDVDQNS